MVLPRKCCGVIIKDYTLFRERLLQDPKVAVRDAGYRITDEEQPSLNSSVILATISLRSTTSFFS